MSFESWIDHALKTTGSFPVATDEKLKILPLLKNLVCVSWLCLCLRVVSSLRVLHLNIKNFKSVKEDIKFEEGNIIIRDNYPGWFIYNLPWPLHFSLYLNALRSLQPTSMSRKSVLTNSIKYH